jgi:thymidine kinase
VSGRTQFILTISRIFNESGVKLFFLACAGDNIDSSPFDDYRIINTFDEVNNQKVIEVIKELTDKKKYNFLIIDDIDYLPKSCLDLLSNIDVIKIATCLTDNCKKLPEESNFYNINDVSDLSDINDFIKGIIRNQKINSVLKDDKSR